jgi:hypothetical protein
MGSDVRSGVLLVSMACGAPAAVDVAFVSPDGDDSAPGTRESPLRTVGRGLSEGFGHLMLLRGVHSEGSFTVDRPVLVEGEEGAFIEPAVRLVGGRIQLRGLWVFGGVVADGADDLEIRTATITPGSAAHAFQIDGGSARLTAVTLECGPETCLRSVEAVVSIDGCRATATATATRRVLHFEGGEVVVRRAVVRGGAIAGLQVDGSADATVSASSIEEGWNGLAVLGGATAFVQDVVVERAVKTSLLLSNASADVVGGRYEATRDLTIGIAGGRAHLRDLSVAGSGFGTFSVGPSFGVSSEVDLDGGVIEHGAKSALLVSGSEVFVLGTRFLGVPDTAGDDAVIANGTDARLRISGATFEAPGGVGVGFYGGASGTVSATIARPRLGGIIVDGSTLAEDVTIEGAVIEDCSEGSGITLQGATSTMIDRVRVERCREAGVVAIGARGAIRSSRIVDNIQIGVAAFGGGVLTVAGTTIAGSPVATFATCEDGARVDLLEGNDVTGPTTDCP